ncbi:DUF4349 domain-containing protein [Amycolatopsis eburnea]|uniref:Uncharacterized protein n=1 Tax=Amycolatopsis eburnea TaxID=2267691 RepID=A0A427TPQ0_9PSEU|nr:hypothetical protein [Amycolatopsis eburnea]RSD26370.1 hypothetical protein EIY87_00465 [Amycolatopsis eburnea]
MTDYTELSATVPSEPPDGSVVLDRAKRAWQRNGSRWFEAGAVISLFTHTGAAWPWLLVDCGPLIPLWQPTNADTAAAKPAEETGFLGFTDHGHPVGARTAPGDVPQPAAVARCGGPGLCPECARDAAVLTEAAARG